MNKDRNPFGLLSMQIVAILLCCQVACSGQAAPTPNESLSTNPSADPSSMAITSTPAPTAPWSTQMREVVDQDTGETRWLVPEDIQAVISQDFTRAEFTCRLAALAGPETLFATLSECYVSPELERQEQIAEAAIRGLENITIEGPGRQHHAHLLSCTPDGWECIIADSVYSGTIRVYNPATHEVISEEPAPSGERLVRIRYNATDGRWRISEYLEFREPEGQHAPQE